MLIMGGSQDDADATAPCVKKNYFLHLVKAVQVIGGSVRSWFPHQTREHLDP
jgi:hypothetical protein